MIFSRRGLAQEFNSAAPSRSPPSSSSRGWSRCGACSNPFAGLQPKLLHLRADLVHVAAKEARGLRYRPAALNFGS
jgi:hypothetical protein